MEWRKFTPATPPLTEVRAILGLSALPSDGFALVELPLLLSEVFKASIEPLPRVEIAPTIPSRPSLRCFFARRRVCFRRRQSSTTKQQSSSSASNPRTRGRMSGETVEACEEVEEIASTRRASDATLLDGVSENDVKDTAVTDCEGRRTGAGVAAVGPSDETVADAEADGVPETLVETPIDAVKGTAVKDTFEADEKTEVDDVLEGEPVDAKVGKSLAAVVLLSDEEGDTTVLDDTDNAEGPLEACDELEDTEGAVV